MGTRESGSRSEWPIGFAASRILLYISIAFVLVVVEAGLQEVAHFQQFLNSQLLKLERPTGDRE